ncbi:SDR family oxidoreductase [Galbibacter orientalis]|uniref:SDR family oxidoreductase n=1 Tax=Galbibacter orientalis TaxID=453852 RepID=UPI003B5202EB
MFIFKKSKVMNESIKDKVVVVTGASSGIGKSIAIQLALKGAKVVLAARNEKKLICIKQQILKENGVAAYVVTDVTKKQDLMELVDIAIKKYGQLDVMINNAGISQLSRLDELDVEGWEEMIATNLNGTLYGMAAAISIFKQQDSGHIINIISTAGLKITPTMGNSSISFSVCF